ncbi:hypothetical protein ZHAS_00015508 [Anopheles sinensis]|uniref:Uncharacterized protein n=1 Tax=Anopheles sinensis TaxID=74873 RepID=A0A084WBF1_ANOSI|nr:hypothetical protein ZHAS_00015508 [Anopheles sinensis]
MWSRQCLLLLLCTSCSGIEDVSKAGRSLKCPKQPDCPWFCGRELPLVNRSSTGAFQTEFMRPIGYRGLSERHRLRHSIFTTPGIQPNECLELSVRCGPTYKLPNSSLDPYALLTPATMLQLAFRCQHFVVTYMAYYKGPLNCYEIKLSYMSHRLRGKSTNCAAPFLRPYQLLGDGYHYFLILLCLDYVLERNGYEMGYWLFVNKRNTAQQNRDIVRQLSSARETVIVANDLLMVVQVDTHEQLPPQDPSACRCDVFEWYMRAVERCQRPFLTPDQFSLKVGNVSSARLNEPPQIAHVEDNDADTANRMADERLRWFVIKCIVFSVVLGLLFYTVWLQLERRTEESLSQSRLY